MLNPNGQAMEGPMHSGAKGRPRHNNPLPYKVLLSPKKLYIYFNCTTPSPNINSPLPPLPSVLTTHYINILSHTNTKYTYFTT
jgi:hypothetical protein